jgi:chondroitin 4-sulfotransferase 11
MISHKHKFIFIHIPKCAGTSIERTIKKHASNVEGCLWARETKNIRNKYMFDLIKNYNDYFKFTFCRNPYCRLVSLYTFFNYHNKFDFKKFTKLVGEFLDTAPEKVFKKVPYNTSALRCVMNPSKGKPGAGSYDFTNEIQYPLGELGGGNSAYHFLPQYYFVSEGIDFIGKVENIQQDFDTICNKVGIPHKQLPHAYKTKHKHYTEYYDDETREIVAEKYAKDIEYFGYEFGE